MRVFYIPAANLIFNVRQLKPESIYELKKNVFFVIVLIFTLYSCNKKIATISDINDVYIAGATRGENDKDVATYWKNGEPTTLDDNLAGSYAEAIAVKGKDVYVAGTIYGPKGQIATYWKNGKPVKLTDGSSDAAAYDIAANGTDVYVAGYTSIANNRHVATYWKKGKTIKLGDGSSESELSHISLIGADVYITGVSGENATYWKNNIPTKLIGNGSFATAISVHGKDVYIGGISPGPHYQYKVSCWKNDRPIAFRKTLLFSHRPGIILNDTDLYIIGNSPDIHGHDKIAYYWKNGIATKLEDNSEVSGATNITVQGSNVYVCGYSPNGALYWKNGVPVHFKNSRENDVANAITVVTR